MFCGSCGTQVEGGKFCPSCGKPLNAQAPSRAPVAPSSVVHPAESTWLYAVLGVSAFLWLGALAAPQSLGGILTVVIGAFVSSRMMASRNMSHGVRVTARQLPDLHAIYMRVAQRLGIADPPPFVVMQQGGVLNAFALKAGSRHQVVMTSTLLSEAGTDTAVVEFILAHELGHHMGGHTQFWRFAASIPVALSLPPLALAWKRKQEFTADRFGLLGCGSVAGSERAMKLLMAGAYGLRADTAELERQAAENHDFFHWLGEISTTHPSGMARIDAIRAYAAQVGISDPRPAQQPAELVQ